VVGGVIHERTILLSDKTEGKLKWRQREPRGVWYRHLGKAKR
jgi:hypothetical protein